MTADNSTPTTPTRRRPVFVYVVVVGMLVLGAYGAVRGMQWSLSLGLGAIGVMGMVALGRPLYRVAVYRIGAQEILCR